MKFRWTLLHRTTKLSLFADAARSMILPPPSIKGLVFVFSWNSVRKSWRVQLPSGSLAKIGLSRLNLLLWPDKLSRSLNDRPAGSGNELHVAVKAALELTLVSRSQLELWVLSVLILMISVDGSLISSVIKLLVSYASGSSTGGLPIVMYLTFSLSEHFVAHSLESYSRTRVPPTRTLSVSKEPSPRLSSPPR